MQGTVSRQQRRAAERADAKRGPNRDWRERLVLPSLLPSINALTDAVLDQFATKRGRLYEDMRNHWDGGKPRVRDIRIDRCVNTSKVLAAVISFTDIRTELCGTPQSDGTVYRPTVADIARRAFGEVSEASVKLTRRALRDLERAGHITCERIRYYDPATHTQRDEASVRYVRLYEIAALCAQIHVVTLKRDVAYKNKRAPSLWTPYTPVRLVIPPKPIPGASPRVWQRMGRWVIERRQRITDPPPDQPQLQLQAAA